MSGVTCHMSCVRCHVSGVTCHMYFFCLFFLSGGASWWRGCYQRGLPRLVYFNKTTFKRLKTCKNKAFLNTVHQNLDTGNGVKFSKYLISPLLYHHIIYFCVLLTNRLIALNFFLYFTQIKEKYVTKKTNMILEDVKKEKRKKERKNWS